MKFRLFLTTLLLSLPALAAAQSATRFPDPAAVPRDVKESEQATEVQRVMRDYGKCLVDKSRRRVEAAIRHFPGSAPAGEAMRNLAIPDCLMYGELRFRPALLRASLFEALYEASFKSAPVEIEATPPIDYLAGAPDPSSMDARDQIALRQFADCVSRADAASSRVLILSRAGSITERTSFSTLGSALSQCLTEGVELKFSRPMLRGLVAETMYRLSSAAKAAPATGSMK